MSQINTYAQFKAPEFDWSKYEDGYDGTTLHVNKKVKTRNKKDKVFSHEPYAQEFYDLLEKHFNGEFVDGGSKDLKTNAVVQVSDIRRYSDHEILIDTNTGCSFVVDMNKEHEFIKAFTSADNGSQVKSEDFVKAIDHVDGFKEAILNNGIAAKQLHGGRLSLWDGYLSKTESEFEEQIKNPTFAYKATVLYTNTGGFICDVQGIKCFMPSSLAAAGVVSDYESYIGKEIPVMVINRMRDGGFIVSYKKYLSTILPHKIETELSVGDKKQCKVTGISKFGIFVQFADNTGDWIFSGLIHSTAMSEDFYKKFMNREIKNDDMIELYIKDIVIEPDKQRVTFTDVDPMAAKLEELANSKKAE